MNNLSFVDDEISQLEELGLKRELKTVITAAGPWIELENKKRVLQFASNNYLGLSNHPEIINASKTAVSKYGVGSTGSRLLSGTTELHVQLEKQISEFEGTESALLFSSGYCANIGVITSLANEKDAIYSDELNHASIIDGIRLSKARKFIYKHNDIADLQRLLIKNEGQYHKNIIVTDTVFSMDGDIAPLNEISQIAEKYNCLVIVDEAHATGVFGTKGAGLVEHLGLEQFFPIKVATCSKSLAVEGAFCAGPKNVIELLKNKARSFIFTTSSSPTIIGATLKSLELVKEGNWRREKLWQNAKLLYTGLKKNYKFKLNKFKCPIICIYFDTFEEVMSFSNKLFNECHIWAPAIRPPSVKEPRIRLTPIATHSEDDINYVVKAFDYLSKDLKTPQLVST